MYIVYIWFILVVYIVYIWFILPVVYQISDIRYGICRHVYQIYRYIIRYIVVYSYSDMLLSILYVCTVHTYVPDT